MGWLAMLRALPKRLEVSVLTLPGAIITLPSHSESAARKQWDWPRSCPETAG